MAASAGTGKGGSGTGSGSGSVSTSERHARLLLAQINRLRAGHSFCDVRLEVGPQAFSVHRLVLAASSPYFAALFAGGMRESGRDVVRIAGVEADTFHTLLDFIYTGEGRRGGEGRFPRGLRLERGPAVVRCPQGW